MAITTPEDWIKTIDLKAQEALKKGWSRYSMEWGVWSAEMNRHIRARIEENDPESTKLKYVFLYWVMISQAVEAAYKKGNKEKIDERRFSETVSFLEQMKRSIAEGSWPTFSPTVLETMMMGKI